MDIIAKLGISKRRANVLNEIEGHLRDKYRTEIQELIQNKLETETTEYVGREKHVKAHKGDLFKVEYPCPHCGEVWNRSFNRCGYYSKSLLTINGHITVRVPRIKCKTCGNKFTLLFSSFIPRARLWLDVISMNAELYGMRASFGLIQQFICRRNKEWLGKYTLMNAIRRLVIKPKAGGCPSEIGLDGMYVRSNQRFKHKNAVVLVATNNDTSDIMDYMWCDSENNENYLAFVDNLEHNFNLHRSKLKNLVSDGHHAILHATENLSRHRTICSFHILKNIQLHATTTKRARKLMHDASVIFKQPSFEKAMQHYTVLEKKWNRLEPYTLKVFKKNLYKTKEAWLSSEYSHTSNITERRIRDIRRKSKAMDNFKSKETSEAVLEMIVEQVKHFKHLGDWFSPIQSRLFA